MHRLEPEIPPTLDKGQGALSMFTVSEPSAARTIHVEITVKKIPLVTEVDTSAAFSLLSEDTLKFKFPEARLQAATVQLKTYTGEPLEVLGSCLLRYSIDSRALNN